MIGCVHTAGGGAVSEALSNVTVSASGYVTRETRASASSVDLFPESPAVAVKLRESARALGRIPRVHEQSAIREVLLEATILFRSVIERE